MPPFSLGGSMNRHYFAGYQRVFINDVNGIEQQLQEFDPELYIMWRPKDNSWLIMDAMTETAVMKIPQIGFETLDQRVYREIRRVAKEGYSAIAEIEANESARKREFERKTNDLAEDFAKEAREAFVNAYDYNRESGATKYVGGV